MELERERHYPSLTLDYLCDIFLYEIEAICKLLGHNRIKKEVITMSQASKMIQIASRNFTLCHSCLLTKIEKENSYLKET